ncbi:MAG: hypothetical protein IT293_01455 [Deltaproteobacteria bacterium]|nr:hypothetical protein [Deltaproteobacteria bacterium]
MNFRLKRIQGLVLLLSVLVTVLAQSVGFVTPMGILIGGLAAWLDFVVIKELGSAMLVRRVAKSHIVPLACAKSVLLVLIPAGALVLPRSVVDGVSFAVGVTMLPLAIVIDACLGIPSMQTGDA